MAKTTADYFSHDTDASLDEKIIYLESLFGDSGYAWFFKMLETLGRAKDFEIEWSELKCGVLARKFNTSNEEFNKFIVAATNPDVRAFVIENGKLYSPGLKARLERMLERRKKEAERIAKKRSNNDVDTTNGNVGATNAQSKVKKSKVKKSINTVVETREKNQNFEGNETDADFKKIEIKAEVPVVPISAEKNPPQIPPAPSPNSQFDDWLQSIETDDTIRRCFTMSRKIPADLFGEIYQSFTLEARTKSESYHRRKDLTDHFLNYAALKHEKTQRAKSDRKPPGYPMRAHINHYDNDRPELYEKQKF